MASQRMQISNALVDLIKANLNGATLPYVSNIYDNVYPRQIFWDEVNEYPTICIIQGSETREYLPGNFKWALFNLTIRIYVDDEEAKLRLEEFFDDLEILLDANNTLTVAGNDLCTDIRILSISDDEGLLNPIGIGEMFIEIRYPVN